MARPVVYDRPNFFSKGTREKGKHRGKRMNENVEMKLQL